jgi:hypothetical protein
MEVNKVKFPLLSCHLLKGVMMSLLESVACPPATTAEAKYRMAGRHTHEELHPPFTRSLTFHIHWKKHAVLKSLSHLIKSIVS